MMNNEYQLIDMNKTILLDPFILKSTKIGSHSINKFEQVYKKQGSKEQAFLNFNIPFNQNFELKIDYNKDRKFRIDPKIYHNSCNEIILQKEIQYYFIRDNEEATILLDLNECQIIYLQMISIELDWNNEQAFEDQNIAPSIRSQKSKKNCIQINWKLRRGIQPYEQFSLIQQRQQSLQMGRNLL
ncbi:unnamed protein product [Paramecium pentaurelia]|uniref:Uncharacterized protein n=1 Tax=Paramecium pentaurelia TaxID=43138 RepID=A0A8S1TTB0_9CILI|nr:unnamed protein product [Paramecium pentaurelia]